MSDKISKRDIKLNTQKPSKSKSGKISTHDFKPVAEKPKPQKPKPQSTEESK